jgi:DNA mismatch repair protein MutL
MNRIILLPPSVSQKIAAGEVIERPFSVVKELVENSLDAQATEIKVELIEGGKRLLRVTDNGQGMSREDVQLAFERHSTSKITSEDDLEHIHTLGFRGEALPSISAVSRLSLKSSEEDQAMGTQIEREGEKILRFEDTAFPRGTCIEVADLFFNLPARKKFLRSERAELNQVTHYMMEASLSFPQVRLTLIHGKRKVFDYPGVGSLKERIFQIYGRETVERLVEMKFSDREMELSGYVTRPPTGKRDRRQQHFFVNSRPVRDKIIQSALNQGVREFLEKDNFVQAFLFLHLPPEEIDVNVHPTKTEVRFKDSSAVFRFVRGCSEQTMLKAMGAKEISSPSEGHGAASGIQEKFFPSYRRDQTSFEAGESPLFPSLESKTTEKRVVLGQYADLYIVVADSEGILIIDQHNAHERVLFERYMGLDAKGKWPQKLPLLPILIDFSPSQLLNWEDNRELLEETGFRLESMGGHSHALKEYPGLFKEEEAKDLFLSLLEEIKGEEIQSKKKKILATLACKTAVKAGEALPKEKMEYLVEELFKTGNFSLCPHGRPIIVKLQREEIDRGMKRVSPKP